MFPLLTIAISKANLFDFSGHRATSSEWLFSHSLDYGTCDLGIYNWQQNTETIFITYTKEVSH